MSIRDALGSNSIVLFGPGAASEVLAGCVGEVRSETWPGYVERGFCFVGGVRWLYGAVRRRGVRCTGALLSGGRPVYANVSCLDANGSCADLRRGELREEGRDCVQPYQEGRECN